MGMRLWAGLALFAAPVFFIPGNSFAVKVQPLVDASILGGQYFFAGSPSNLSAIATVQAIPMISFSENTQLIPSYRLQYRGSKEITELVGGGTLFQQSAESVNTLKFVHKTGAVKLKPNGSFRQVLMRETVDEKWFSGLFDYRKYSGGMEAEIELGNRRALSLAYDYYYIHFYNYKTLESQSSAQTQDLGRQLSAQNNKVLNTHNHQVTLGLKWAFNPKWELRLGHYQLGRPYPQQFLVNAAGQFTTQQRNDYQFSGSMGVTFAHPFSEVFKLVASVDYTADRMESNQHDYDARNAKWNQDYYSYTQHAFAPRFDFLISRQNWLVTLSGAVQQCKYDNRPVRDSNGTYTGGVISTTIGYGTLAVTVPVGKNFKIVSSGSWGKAYSNMKYEQFYKYNYTTASYGLGFAYSY